MGVVDFRRNEWKLANATKHGVTIEEAERVIRLAARPYPKRHAGDKWIAVGRGNSQRMLEVIFVYDDRDRTAAYVIHAIPSRGHRSRKRRPGRR